MSIQDKSLKETDKEMKIEKKHKCIQVDPYLRNHKFLGSFFFFLEKIIEIIICFPCLLCKRGTKDKDNSSKDINKSNTKNEEEGIRFKHIRFTSEELQQFGPSDLSFMRHGLQPIVLPLGID